MRHKKEVAGLVQLELLDLSHNKLTASLHEVREVAMVTLSQDFFMHMAIFFWLLYSKVDRLC